MSNADLYEIKTDPGILHQYIDFDVYYRKIDGRFGLYKKKGASFDSMRVKSGKLPEYLYVSLHDKIIQVRDQTRRLNKKLVTELKADPVRAKKRLSELVSITLSVPRGEILENIKDTIDIVVSEYLSSPDVIKNLSKVSIKDYSTQLHLTNVMVFCLGYARYAGYDVADMKLLGLIGLLHDVGKVDVPDDILTAPRKLSDEEFELIKKHPRKGEQMLKECDFDEKVPICALEHHERLDGSGYPDGKQAKELDIHSRALAIIDIYEALTTWRPYKEPIPSIQALRILKKETEDGKLDRTIFRDLAYSVVGLSK